MNALQGLRSIYSSAELCDSNAVKFKKMEEIKRLRFEKPDENGWEFNYDFLLKLKLLSQEETDLEEIQSILIALCNIA